MKAPTMVMFIVFFLQLVTRFLERLKKGGSVSAEQTQLRQEIKQLLREASSLSTPSTFAKAAKLRRIAAAKEKELKQSQQPKDLKGPYDSYLEVLRVVKVFTYIGLSWWFWGAPIASISHQLLQPFGRILSWKAGNAATEHLMVGIVPWLILTTRVSHLIFHKFPM